MPNSGAKNLIQVIKKPPQDSTTLWVKLKGKVLKIPKVPWRRVQVHLYLFFNIGDRWRSVVNITIRLL
jgi:hypothetical protein